MSPLFLLIQRLQSPETPNGATEPLISSTCPKLLSLWGLTCPLPLGWWFLDPPRPAHQWPSHWSPFLKNSQGRQTNIRALGSSMTPGALLRFLQLQHSHSKLKGKVRAGCEKADFSPGCSMVTTAAITEPAHHCVIIQNNIYCHSPYQSMLLTPLDSSE